jgi:signal transduction histidine kinase/ligand-binding sensor domain-containing protein
LHKTLTLTKLFILCIVSVSLGQSFQDIKFQSLDIIDGLPSNSVKDIKADKYGFIWIATTEGLCRYESPNRIKRYDKNDFGLVSNQVSYFHISDDNIFWIGTRNGGVSKYDEKTGEYDIYTTQNKQLSHNDVNFIYEDDDGKIWIGTEDGLNIHDPSNGNWSTHLAEPEVRGKLQAKSVLSISSDNKGWKWIGTWDGGLYLVLDNGDENTAPIFRQFIPTNNPSSKNIWRIFQDSAGRYWVTTHDAGLYLMQLPENASNHPDNQAWEPIFHNYTEVPSKKGTLTSNYIYDISEDLKGNIWLACIRGVNIISANQLEAVDAKSYSQQKPELFINNIVYDNTKKGSINSINIHFVYRDNNGMMWLGSNRGMNMFDWNNSKFQIYDLNKFTEFNNSTISSIIVDKENTIWIASQKKGLIKYYIEDNSIVSVNKDINTSIPTELHSITLTGDSILLGGEKSFGVYLPSNNEYRHVEFPEHIVKLHPTIFTTKLTKDNKNRIWIGTEKGLLLYNENYEFIDFFRIDSEGTKRISDNSITDIYQDTEGIIWVSTYNGLNILKETPDGLSFIQFQTGHPSEKFNLPSNQINSIAEYENKIYFGSQNSVFLYDKIDSSFHTIPEISKNNFNSSIKISPQGNLISSNFDGISKYNLETKNITYVEKYESIDNITHKLNSSFLVSNDKVLYSMQNGFIEVDLTGTNKIESFIPVHITDAILLDKKGETVINLIHENEIKIPPEVYHITFHYAGLNYNYPKHNLYAYKLEGFEDDEWKYSSFYSPAIFTNLKHGTYTFKVMAADNEGIWNKEGDSITVVVKAAFYETLLFKLLSIILFALIVLFAFKYYTRNITMRNKQLNQEINDRKLAESALLERDIKMKMLLAELGKSNTDLERSNKDLERFAYVASHDLKEPLRTIGTFTDLLRHKFESQLTNSGKEYIYFITDGVQRMSSLINSLLTYSRAGNEFKEMDSVNLNELVNNILNDLSTKISEKNVQIELKELPQITCNKDQISMLFSNLILNGIKFNNKNKPTVKISYSDKTDHWQFSIEDNGIGIAKEYQNQIFEIFKRLHRKEDYEGTGIGLALCQRIVNNHSGKIWIESTVDKGSIFHFTIAKDLDSELQNNQKLKKQKLKEEVEFVLNN